MVDNARRQEQILADARMEHQELISSFHVLSHLVWASYGTFFTVNTLLATMLAASYSSFVKDGSLSTLVLLGFRVLITVIGITTAGTSVYVSVELFRLRKLNNFRGRQVEQILFARTFHDLQSFAESPPFASHLGSATFALIWLGLLTAVVVRA